MTRFVFTDDVWFWSLSSHSCRPSLKDWSPKSRAAHLRWQQSVLNLKMVKPWCANHRACQFFTLHMLLVRIQAFRWITLSFCNHGKLKWPKDILNLHPLKLRTLRSHDFFIRRWSIWAPDTDSKTPSLLSSSDGSATGSADICPMDWDWSWFGIWLMGSYGFCKRFSLRLSCVDSLPIKTRYLWYNYILDFK